MSNGSEYGKRRRACKTEQTVNWQNAQKITKDLEEDGWVSPNTYARCFAPLTDGAAVYLFLLANTWDYRQGLVAYVGMSTCLKQRIAGHNILPSLKKPGFWPFIWFKPVHEADLREVEAHYISAFDPPLNIVGRTRGLVLQ